MICPTSKETIACLKSTVKTFEKELENKQNIIMKILDKGTNLSTNIESLPSNLNVETNKSYPKSTAPTGNDTFTEIKTNKRNIVNNMSTLPKPRIKNVFLSFRSSSTYIVKRCNAKL